mgnify:CR=1 FL=1
MASIEEKVTKLVEPIIENLGYELYDVEYAKEGKNYFRIDLKLNNAVDYFKMENGMEGTATILLSDRSLMKNLLPTGLFK